MCATATVEHADVVSIGFPDRMVHLRHKRPTDLDLNAAHHFRFVSQGWVVGLDACIRGLLALVPGVFLLVEAFITPTLKLQIGAAGALLVILGVVSCVEALPHFLGTLTIDRTGLSLRRVRAVTTIPWDELEKWSISESDGHGHSPPEFALYARSISGQRLAVSSGTLGYRNLPRIRSLLEYFAPEEADV
jgi:hypothetical protein